MLMLWVVYCTSEANLGCVGDLRVVLFIVQHVTDSRSDVDLFMYLVRCSELAKYAIASWGNESHRRRFFF